MVKGIETKTGKASLLDIVRHLLEKGAGLPTIPTTARKVLEAVRNPDCSLSDLEAIIRRDPALAARIIKVVNSSFFAGMKEIHTLPEAFMRLGFARVKDLAVAMGMKKVYRGVDGHLARELEALWRNAVASGTACREIAATCGCSHDEEAFLAGLVHDIGSAFIIQVLHGLGKKDPAVRALPKQTIQELLAALHPTVGAEMLENWHFPETICQAVRHHHEPERCPSQGKLAWILAAGDLLVRKLGLDGRPPEEDLSLATNPAFQALQLSDLEIGKLLVEMEEKAKEIEEALA